MKNGILYIADAADGGADGGAGAAALEGGQGEGEGQQQQQQDGKGGEGDGDGQGQQQPPALTAEALAAAMKQAGIGEQRQQQLPAKQYSQDDFDKAFHVVRPNEDQLKAMLAGGAPAVTVLTELLHAAARQAVVMSAYQIQELKATLEGRLAPVEQYRQMQEEQSLREEFKTQNEDLKGFEAVGEEVLKAMKTEGVTFKTKAEAFTAIRDRVIKTIKSLPGFEQWKPGNKQQQNGSKSQMSTLSRGGGSGGAAAGQGQQARGGEGKSRGQASVGASVFD